MAKIPTYSHADRDSFRQELFTARRRLLQPRRARRGSAGWRARDLSRCGLEELETRLLLATASFVPSKDNTLYEDSAGALSNGFGPNLFAGRTNEGTDNLRRALLRFDLGQLAPGSLVTDASLELTVTRDPSGNTPPHNFAVHRVLQDWGEGGSLDPSAGGKGRDARVNDATWLHTAFETAFWDTPGGDFEPTASATTSVGNSGTVARWSSPTLVSDVQAWINDPTGNFGWIIRGDENTPQSARRFSSRQGIATPILTVTTTDPGPSVTLDVNTLTIAEESGQAVFTARMSESVMDDVVVELGFSGTATFGEDYSATATQIVIPAGGSDGTITINTIDDLIGENDETVIVEILSVDGANEAGQQSATTTITDGDGGPVVPEVTLSVDPDRIVEDAGAATFTATLSAATSVPVQIDLQFSGSATSGADYTASGSQITIPPGRTSGSITVTAVQDTVEEGDETIVVAIDTVENGVESGTQQQIATITDDDATAALSVESFTATNFGFVIEFSNAVDVTTLNLYGREQGAADVVLSGARQGAITGSLATDASAQTVTFAKTGGPLLADTYTVRLRSEKDGFQDLTGGLLDGDGDGVAGGDYTNTFTVDPRQPNTAALQIPDFVRGAGQPVNIPADSDSGLPLSISIEEGMAATTVDLRIGYDPSLLEITDATAGPAMPPGSFVVLIDDSPGLAILAFRSGAALPVGTNVLVHLEATVPTADAAEHYGRSHVLDIHGVTVGDGDGTEFPTEADGGFHLASYLADVSGNRRINASDASQVAQFAALLETGFDAGSQSVDPFIVADISGNGRINAGDASLLARFAALLDVPEIPPVPRVAFAANVGTPVPQSSLEMRFDAEQDSAFQEQGRNSDSPSFDTPDHFVSAIADTAWADERALESMLASIGDDELESLLETWLPGNE